MSGAATVLGVSAALELMLVLTLQLQRLSELLHRAQAEKRDVTEAELRELVGDDEAAKSALDAAIAAAKARGQ